MASALATPVFAPLASQSALRFRRSAARSQKLAGCRVVCKAQQLEKESSPLQKFALPLTAAIAASLVLGAVDPDAALAARSAGRMGGSSFRSSAPRAAPQRSSAPSQGPSVRNYNYYGGGGYAPPLVGGYGYGGGFGGFNIMPTFGVPVYGLGSFFNIIFAMFVLSAVVSVARSIFSRRGGGDDDFEDFD